MILCSSKHFEIIRSARERVFNFLTLRLYFPFCKAVYAGKGSPISLESLASMPPNSLGKHTAGFLKAYGLTPMPGYEAHDMKHTLLGFAANMKGEICMQYFEFGNGNRSLPVITVMFFGTLFMPEELSEYLSQYRRGKAAQNLTLLDLKQVANQSITHLRKLWNL